MLSTCNSVPNYFLTFNKLNINYLYKSMYYLIKWISIKMEVYYQNEINKLITLVTI